MRSTRKEELGQIPCNHGIDQSTDDLGAPVGAFRAATNMRIRAGGLLEKRAGTYAPTITLAEGGNRITGSADFVVDKPGWLGTVGADPALGVTSGKIFAYRKAVDGGAPDRFSFQGVYSTARPVQQRAGLATVDSSLGASCISEDGYVLTSAPNPDSGSTCRLVLEGPGGQRFWNLQLVGTRVRLLRCGAGLTVGHFVAVYSSGTDIRAMRIDPSSPSASADASIGTLSSSAAYWDVSPYTEETFYMVHQNDAAQITISNVNVPGAGGDAVVVDTTFQNVTGTIPVSIYADPDNGLVWVGRYDDPSGTGIARVSRLPASLNSAIFSIVATGTANIGPPLMGRYRDYASGGTSSSAVLFAMRHVRTSPARVCATRIGTVQSDGTVSAVRDIWGCLPISKPDNYNRFWTLVTTTDESQLVQRAVLVRIVDADSAGSNNAASDKGVGVELSSPQFLNFDSFISDGPAGNYDYFQGQSSSLLLDAAARERRSVFALPRVLARDATSSLHRLDVYEYATGEEESHSDVLSLGPATIVAGQPVAVWGDPPISGSTEDAGAAEIGFAQTPVLLSATPASFGSMANGTYSYRIVWEWADLYGNRHLSAPSPPVEVTLTGSNTAVALVFTAPTVGQRPFGSGSGRQDVTAIVYRTVSGGSSYHAVARDDGAALSNGTQSFTDTLADDTIRDEEILYTDGGVLQNDLAPSCRFMCKSEDRIWCGGLWDPRIVQCSKVVVPGEATNFTEHPSHQVFMPDDVTGLAYQDGQVIAFCSRSIYLVSGDGPNDQGFGSFPPPRGYSQDLGCDDYRSVLETRIGVIFKSQKGYYLIPRGFGPLVYIGAQIRDELETNGLTKVYAAAVHGGNISAERYGGHLARWLVGTESSTYATNVLTFDIDNGQWFKDTLDATNGRMLEMGAWPDGFAFVSSNLNADTNSTPIWYETGPYVGDASNAYYVPQRLQTASYQPFGPLGYGRIKRVLVGMKAAPTLACRVTLNVTLDENATQTATWTIPTGGLPQYRELPLSSPQMCSTLRIAVEDSALDDVVSPGVKLVAIGFEADDSDGFRQLELTERA